MSRHHICGLPSGKLIDITRPLSEETPVWPGDISFSRETLPVGEFQTSSIRMSVHCGTHMDAPSHISGNSISVDRVPFESLLCRALVVDRPPDGRIEESFLRGLDLEGVALLVRTWPDNEGCPGTLAPEAAELAVSQGVSLLGCDACSVDMEGESVIHRILLGSGIPAVENLLLDGVTEGEYFLVCLPLPLKGADGSPVRAFLITQE